MGAVKFLRRAAERAEQRDDWLTADRYLSHAIPLLDGEDRAGLLPLRLARARARAELRDTVGARRDLESVLVDAKDVGDPATLAAATTVLGDVEYKEGNLDRSAETLDDAIAQWRVLGDARGLGDALRFRGLTDLFRGELDGASKFIGESLVHFQSIDHRRGEAWALQNLAWISFVRGERRKQRPGSTSRRPRSASCGTGAG